MPEQKFKVGDHVKSGVLIGRVIQVLPPDEPAPGLSMPRYLVRSDDGIHTVVIAQHGLKSAKEENEE